MSTDHANQKKNKKKQIHTISKMKNNSSDMTITTSHQPGLSDHSPSHLEERRNSPKSQGRGNITRRQSALHSSMSKLNLSLCVSMKNKIFRSQKSIMKPTCHIKASALVTDICFLYWYRAVTGFATVGREKGLGLSVADGENPNVLGQL